ncbi:MAG: hypothetical protein FWB83_10850 [Treponema sp.]|nr:hypothetical protein [Treponema sp.]
MIRKCNETDLKDIYHIINDSVAAYKGKIPNDRYHEPYMTMEELKSETNDGVIFWGYEENNSISGVMGIQEKNDVSLIRHDT